MMLGYLVLIALSIVSQLIALLSSPLQSNLLIWIILIPLILICIYPILFSREVLRQIFEVVRDNGLALPFNSNLAAIAMVAMFTTIIWFLPPFGDPPVAISRLLAMIGLLYLWVEAFYSNPRDNTQGNGWSQNWIMSSAFAFITFLFIETGLSCLAPRGEEIWGNVGIAFMGLGLGNIRRTQYLSVLERALSEIQGKPQSVKRTELPTNLSIPTPKEWYRGSGLIFLAAGISVSLWLSTPWAIAIPLAYMLIGTLVGAIAQLRSNNKNNKQKQASTDNNSSFRPQPHLVLGFKAFLCVVVSIQLLHPFLAQVSQRLAKPSLPHNLFQYPSLAAATTLFSDRNVEISWISLLFLCCLGIYYLEYEWVVRPFLQQRTNALACPAPHEDKIPGWSAGAKAYQALASVTLPWILYRSWLPILTISVNLGFERLDHRRVVHSMLAGLRAKYYRAFLSWKSGLANLLRILGSLLILLLVNLIGRNWFDLPPIDPAQTASLLSSRYSTVCTIFQGAQSGPAVANLICKLPGGETLFKILYYDLFHKQLSQSQSSEHFLFDLLLPYRSVEWPPAPSLLPIHQYAPVDIATWVLLNRISFLPQPTTESHTPFYEKGIHFATYHLLLFAFLYVVARWLASRLPILPYRETVNRIDEVMDFLSARTSVTSRTNRWEPVQVLQGWLTDERIRQIEQEPVDPRTVEFLFLQILDDIQATSLQLAGSRQQRFSLPTPEVTFVFDELDKLGTRVNASERDTSGGPQQVEILHAERRRSVELHRLLADMKNLLSSAPARFVFVGGRNLHDEWLADQSARQPLLTSIFNAEVYLPALVTDFGRVNPEGRTLAGNIRIYLESQLDRAVALYVDARRKLLLPSLALPIEDVAEETFLPEPLDYTALNDDLFANLCCCDQVELLENADRALPKLIYRDFFQFLTLRSMGNPKRLKELLGTFIRPVGRVVKSPTRRWTQPFDACEHVLAFGDSERFRLQLLARIYRHLMLTFEQRLVRRDDKLTISVFFLADFLFKFHRRAFSWSNLERADELVHIHRAPDLREVLEAMVAQWSERFLHPIRNGMYDFRFRSDLAHEVEYISRLSHEEMAAFNFTLDESQALKSAYLTNITQLKEKIGREPIDMVAGLGELHEFDQEHEEARVYYRRAIALLDKELEDVAGTTEGNACAGGQNSSAVFDVMSASGATGKKLAQLYITWGVARLRLMLQIGMTFEVARNLERAGVEYRNARILATVLRTAMLNQLSPQGSQGTEERDDDEHTEETLHPLKHLIILFQAAFAEVWVAEKMTGAVDTSISLAERELWTLRNELPFVRDLRIQPAQSPVMVRGSNFSLIVAELHNKAGDLYFFKGRQRVTVKDLESMQGTENNKGLEGYLIRAHYHYAVALHELSRLVTYRRISSPNKLHHGNGSWETIGRENWPDFIYRSAGGSLNDLAEAMLGRVSLYGLLRNVGNTGATANTPDLMICVVEAKRKLTRTFVEWMESAWIKGHPCPHESAPDSRLDHPNNQLTLSMGTEKLDIGTLAGWLGAWTSMDALPDGRDCSLLDLRPDDYQDNMARLAMSLQLKLVGSKLLEKGGYIEDAAHELLSVCEVVTNYLWWIHALRCLVAWSPDTPANPMKAVKDILITTNTTSPFWGYLHALGLYSLQKADKLFRRGRRAEENATEDYLIGDKIPIAQLFLTCSLGLVSEKWARTDLREPLTNLLAGWNALSENHTAQQSSAGISRTIDRKKLQCILEKALIRHSYPMINRLHGLKILIDDSLLDEDEKDCSTRSIAKNEKGWIDEMLKLSADLDAPRHFSPLHSGITCTLGYFRSRSDKLVDVAWQQRVRRAAQRDLQASEEMYTLRRAYYESVAPLYYLYDDFNDRQIHISHSIQMAGAELNGLLLYMVTEPDYYQLPAIVPQTKTTESLPEISGIQCSKNEPSPSTIKRSRANSVGLVEEMTTATATPQFPDRLGKLLRWLRQTLGFSAGLRPTTRPAPPPPAQGSPAPPDPSAPPAGGADGPAAGSHPAAS